MVKLTRDIINRSPQYRNPLKDREIDLRGNKITILENIGVTQDGFDSIDLSDNDLKKLEGFPVLKRLKLLLVCNNHISRVADDIAECLPRLRRLILTNNNIQEITDLFPITKMRSLHHLCLMRNPIANHPHYRSFLVYHMPFLKVLDCQKVGSLEIDEATRKFSGIEGLKLLNNIIETRYRLKLDEDDISSKRYTTNENSEAIKRAINNAKTLEEVREVENLIKTGGFLNNNITT